jgi:ribosome maturation factor RimP
VEQTEMSNPLEQKFILLCEEVVSNEGLELYDLEFLEAQGLLRLYIQNPESKAAVIEDCVRIDHAMTDHVENLEWMPNSLTLEVSSPGVYRGLRTKKHYEAVIGEQIEIVTFKRFEQLWEDCPKPLAQQKRIECLVQSVGEEDIVISVNESNFKLNLLDIKRAKLSPAWKELERN